MSTILITSGEQDSKLGIFFALQLLIRYKRSMRGHLKDRKLKPDNLSSRIGVEMTGVLLPHKAHILLFMVNSNTSENLPTSLHLQDVEETGGSDNQRQISHGGHLQYFWKVWEDLCCHPRGVQILRWGYQIILQSNLPLSVHPIIQSGYNRQEKHGYLNDKQFTISKIAQLQVFTADYFLYPNPAKNGAL